eukprot:2932626-Ditylum_brightwellii.AAC.1
MIVSSLRLNTIKFDNTVYAQFLKANLYVKPDLYDHNDVISPGQINCANPKLIHCEDFITEIRGDIKQHPVHENNITQQQMTENNVMDTNNTK